MQLTENTRVWKQEESEILDRTGGPWWATSEVFPYVGRGYTPEEAVVALGRRLKREAHTLMAEVDKMAGELSRGIQIPDEDLS